METLRVERRILRSTPNLPAKMGKESLHLVPENIVRFNEVKQYPFFNENNRGIRFSPFTGEIYISTYRHSLKNESQSQPSEEEIVLMQRGRKPSQEILQRWNKYPDIECAVRSAEHVLNLYGKEGGEMVDNTRGAINLTKRLLTKFELRGINKENLEIITQETLEELALLGFGDAEKPIRQRIALQITNAVGKDKLERLNPLISRTRLASAWLKAIRELLVAKKVREKFSVVMTDLLSERTIERFYLSQAAILIQDMLENQNSDDLKSKISVLKTFSSTFLTPEKIKVAPYRKAALLSHYSLFGIRNKSEKDLLIVASENEQESLDILSFKPINEVLEGALFKKNACWEVQERLIKSLVTIKNVLDKGGNDLKEKII